MKRTYLVKLVSTKSLPDLMAKFGELGTVLALSDKTNEQQPAPSRYAAPRVESAAAREKKTIVARKRVAEHYSKVCAAMTPILQANQHAPLEVIVREMNKTDLKTMKLTTWNLENIKPYLDYTLGQMTAPNP